MYTIQLRVSQSATFFKTYFFLKGFSLMFSRYEFTRLHGYTSYKTTLCVSFVCGISLSFEKIWHSKIKIYKTDLQNTLIKICIINV